MVYCRARVRRTLAIVLNVQYCRRMSRSTLQLHPCCDLGQNRSHFYLHLCTSFVCKVAVLVNGTWQMGLPIRLYLHSTQHCTVHSNMSSLNTHSHEGSYIHHTELAGRSDTDITSSDSNGGSVEKKPVNSAAQLLNFTKSDIQGRTQTWQKSNEIVSWSWY